MTPRASFVIPAYNMERWVSKAIYSCRNQTIKQIEIIVVNDGSADGTKEIIEWHAKEDSRVKVINVLANQGRSGARNLGNEAATAPFILVLDADDMATRNRAKDTVIAFELKKADMVYGSFFIVDSIGNVERKVIATPLDTAAAKAKQSNFICHSTMAFTKELSSRIKYEAGDFERLGLDDWRFQWDVINSGAVIKHLRSPLAYYRITQDGISAQRDTEDVKRVKDAFLATI
jgi:glycosyltransferase involved in cell wall biosynthesis